MLNWNKSAEITYLITCEINYITPGFYLPSLEAYSEPSHTSKMERFSEIVNDWIPLTVAKNFLLDVWRGFNYSGFYSIIINWGCHFESSKNLSNVISILLKYLEENFFFRCNRIMFQTCLS